MEVPDRRTFKREDVIGAKLRDVAFSDEGMILFQIGAFWVTPPWAGHLIEKRFVSDEFIRLSKAPSQEKKPDSAALNEWLVEQRAVFSIFSGGVVVDVWSGNFDIELGFNDPGENWLVFESDHCLSVDYPTPIFGPSLSGLVHEEAAAVRARSATTSYFDLAEVGFKLG